MTTQYAFKAVTQTWHDPDVPQAPGDSFPGTATFTVGSTITAPAAGQATRPASFLSQFLTPPPLACAKGEGVYLTSSPRLGPLPDDALTAIVAFDNPQWPWDEMLSGDPNGIWPRDTGKYAAGHLLRLTYDDVTDLVVRNATAWGDGGTPPPDGEGYTTVLLLRACYIDAEMILPSGSGGFILGSNDP